MQFELVNLPAIQDQPMPFGDPESSADRQLYGPISPIRIAKGVLTIKQLNFVPLESSTTDKDAIIATINASGEGIKIVASKITISGDCTFESGYDPTGKVAAGGSASDVNSHTTTISGGKITAFSITASQVAADAITADKINVNTLSAIAANLGTVTAGSITGVTITGGIIQTATSGKRIVISDNTLYLYNSSGDVIASLESLESGFATGLQVTAIATTFTRVGVYDTWSPTDIGACQGMIGPAEGGGMVITTMADAGYLGDINLYPATNYAVYVGGHFKLGGRCYTNFHPGTSDTYQLGNSTYLWKGVYTGTIGLLTYNGKIYCTGSTTTRWGEIYHDNANPILDSSYGYWKCGTIFAPTAAGTYDLGGSALYWNGVYYKTLNDMGCLGSFDDGVELQDGRRVSDCEALMAIERDSEKKTVYGVPRLKYSTFPKVSYLKPKTKEDAEGVEMTSMFSIMIGSIRELHQRLITLENKN